jgi:hypothetical protein
MHNEGPYPLSGMTVPDMCLFLALITKVVYDLTKHNP